MAELERMLTELGRELDYPPTPARAARGTAALAELEPERGPDAGAARRRSRRTTLVRPALLRRPLALAALALLLLAGAAFAAAPGVRDAVLELLGLPELAPLELGRRVSLAKARAALDFDPVVPAALGRPDAVFVRDVPGGELSLAYRPRRGLPAARTTRLGLLVSEFRGDLLPEYLGKIAGVAASVERLNLDGERAIWIEGAPHLFFYRSPRKDFAELPLRLAQNVLLVERGRLLVRLEGAFERRRAIALARSLR